MMYQKYNQKIRGGIRLFKFMSFISIFTSLLSKSTTRTIIVGASETNGNTSIRIREHDHIHPLQSKDHKAIINC